MDGWTLLDLCLVHPYSDLDSRGAMQGAMYYNLNTERIEGPMSIQMKKSSFIHETVFVTMICLRVRS